MRSRMIVLAAVMMLAAACSGHQDGSSSQATTTVTTSAPSTTSTMATTTTETPAEEGAEGVARPSNAGGPGDAVELKGDVSAGEQVFVAYCQVCHGPQGTDNVANPGSDDGTVPPLNPIDDTMVSSDYKTFATNIDLFIEHGSTPEGSGPEKTMPAWGDQGMLSAQQIADVIAYTISLNTTATTTTSTPAEEGAEGVARPSNAGGPGDAVELKGDVSAGEQVFVAYCQVCHGPQGTDNVANPGSDDGTVPPLNPIDDTMVSSDYKTFATNIDLFIEHGSTPEGSGPEKTMPAWGDQGMLSAQQIADVIAYTISLNTTG